MRHGPVLAIAAADLEGDGDLDLIFHFRAKETGYDCESTQLTLTGATFSGKPIVAGGQASFGRDFAIGDVPRNVLGADHTAGVGGPGRASLLSEQRSRVAGQRLDLKGRELGAEVAAGVLLDANELAAATLIRGATRVCRG